MAGWPVTLNGSVNGTISVARNRPCSGLSGSPVERSRAAVRARAPWGRAGGRSRCPRRHQKAARRRLKAWRASSGLVVGDAGHGPAHLGRWPTWPARRRPAVTGSPTRRPSSSSSRAVHTPKHGTKASVSARVVPGRMAASSTSWPSSSSSAATSLDDRGHLRVGAAHAVRHGGRPADPEAPGIGRDLVDVAAVPAAARSTGRRAQDRRRRRARRRCRGRCGSRRGGRQPRPRPRPPGRA